MHAEPATRWRRVSAGLVASITVAAVAAVLFATGPQGPGLTIDSTTYLLAADSYGRDLSDVGPVLNGVFPPGYSAAIAAMELLVRGDLHRAAVLVNVVSLAAVLALIGHGVWTSTTGSHLRRRSAATVATVGVVATSTAVLQWSGAAMSEMFSLLFVFASMAIAARYADTDRTSVWILVGVVGGAAALVRLVALGSVLGIALGVLFVVRRSLGRRLLAAATVAVSGIVTSVVGVPLLQSANDSKRTIAWHPISGSEVREGLDTVASYTLPSSISGTAARLGAVVVLLLFVVFVVQVARRSFSEPGSLPAPCVLATTVAIAHIATVLGSMFLIDDLTPLDPRILLPVVPLVALAVGSAAAADRPVSPRIVLVVALLVVFGQLGRLDAWMDGMRSDGMGYAHTLFDGSETVAAVRALPAGAEVWTNDVSLLYLRADRRAAQLPSDTDNYSGRATDDYDEMIDALGDRLDAGAVIVYADYFDFTTLPDVDELEREIGPLRVEQLSDGKIVRRDD